jgi:hypothetical protein
MEAESTEILIKNVSEALEEMGFPDEHIEEAISLVTKSKNDKALSTEGDGAIRRLYLKRQILQENDWRKKAGIAALLISNEL